MANITQPERSGFGLIITCISVLILASSFAPSAARAQMDVMLYQECLKDCGQYPSPCCKEVCAYRACIAGQTQAKSRSGLDMVDPGAGDAARAACAPHEQIINDCVKKNAALEKRPQKAEPTEPAGPPFMNLPCCKYWLVQKDGRYYVTGYYFNQAKQKVDYTSDALSPVHLADTTKGLFAVTGGNGYHLYFHDDYDLKTGLGTFVVTRLGDKVEPLHRIQFAGRCYLKFAPDFSYIEVIHNTPDDRQAFDKIVLR